MNHFLSLLVTAAIAAPLGHALATPISANMNLTAFVEIDGNTNTQTDSGSWSVTPSTLTVNASASASATNALATAGGLGRATWAADGNAGSVAFTNYGWNIVADIYGWSTSLNTGASDWAYTFLADADGAFSMTYLVSSNGFQPGLQGWDILWSGAGGGLDLTDFSSPDAIGVFTRDLIAGNSYTVSLKNNASLSGEDDGETSGSMNGQFDFSISSNQQVPEPATLVLLGIGLAGLGFLRRRRFV